MKFVKLFIIVILFPLSLRAGLPDYAPMAKITYEPLLKVLEKEIIPYVQLNKRSNTNVIITIEQSPINDPSYARIKYDLDGGKFWISIYIQWVSDKLNDYIKNKIEETKGNFYIIDIEGINIYFTSEITDNKIIKPITKKKYLGQTYDEWWWIFWGDETYTSISFICGDNLFRCVNIDNVESYFRPEIKKYDSLLPSLPLKVPSLSHVEVLLKQFELQLNSD